MAEKSPVVSGPATFQVPVRVGSGVWEVFVAGLGARIMGNRAEPAMSRAESKVSLTICSILDWPEASQTSPTRMPVRVRVFLPLITMLAGVALAGRAGRFTRHLPAASAVVSAVLPEKETETFSPASAMPQTGMGLSR